MCINCCLAILNEGEGKDRQVNNRVRKFATLCEDVDEGTVHQDIRIV